MSKIKMPPMRSDETGSHVRSDSPVDLPAQDLDIETLDKKRSEGSADEDGGERHEKRPEGPYKDPADEQKQGKVK
ncbi:hypothetical protein [Chenggangzhangella methanolivorans]|uniref:Uncharacterized protein n=1 Tax=Chenggangzhangella methanolivorans TaxID=1437009 RepID=A0A9E6RB40_9HYPH|nr:hypothetical protein [Chenggangzhangella methanolivorans]QZO01105.1 hypothetical protein K6K41_05900 [Chenggangzhangella methanolivorans]